MGSGGITMGAGGVGEQKQNRLYCLDEEDGSVLWAYLANGGMPSSPVVSTYYDDGDGEV